MKDNKIFKSNNRFCAKITLSEFMKNAKPQNIKVHLNHHRIIAQYNYCVSIVIAHL